MGAKRLSGLISAGGLIAGLAVASAAVAGSLEISGAGGNFSVPVTSLYEARFQTVIRQQYDYSCGSAAVATLLTYHYDRPTGEKQVFEAMFAAGDQEKIRKLGFSMLDMKAYLEAQGFHADGFRISLDKLVNVGVPAITLINTKGYKHFVLVKGLTEDEILVGDPALGVKVYPRAKFEKLWNGILFAIRDKATVARAHFNQKQDWGVRPKAPIGTALSRDGLGVFSLQLGRSQF